ncbi:MAG: rod shape-determining protein MreC [Taibaiella sp.]|nr:rod shape-determining protein MreC [Taibaiella sp.]
MRNFILFIRRFSNLILFLLLEVICIMLISRTQTVQGDDIMSSANMVIGNMYKQRNDVAYYFALRRMNDSLLRENTELRKRLTARAETDIIYDSAATVPITVTDSGKVVKYADYVYRTARVINNSVGNVNNYITLNRGSKDGVKKDMAVISSNGAIGRVVNTSAHFSTAISVLSKKQQVSAKLKDGTVGYVSWDGKDPSQLVMRDVPTQIKVRKGDTVFTTEYSFFPANIRIGTVYKTTLIKSKNLQVLYLRPTANFRNLQYVYVVENKMSAERRRLEEAAKKDDDK